MDSITETFNNIVIAVPRNCHEYFNAGGLTQSGLHLIDPDGPSLGTNPFYAYCDMSTGPQSVHVLSMLLYLKKALADLICI